MSNPEPSAPTPRALADRLFSRFVAMYGSQKVGAMWADADPEAVRDTWAAAIGRYAPHSIARAVAELLDSGREWPPTLPEFCELCRRGALARQQSQDLTALPAPGGTHTTRDEAGAILQRIGAADVLAPKRDHKAWARRILDRVAQGDTSVCGAARTMAQAALQ